MCIGWQARILHSYCTCFRQRPEHCGIANKIRKRWGRIEKEISHVIYISVSSWRCGYEGWNGMGMWTWSIAHHFLRCILWILRINWPVAVVKAEGHGFFSRVPTAIKSTVNLTMKGKDRKTKSLWSWAQKYIFQVNGKLI